LTVADLLKNYLFGLARASLGSVEKPWLSAVSTLDTPGGSQQFLDFLRHYWSSWHGATRERDLYRSLRRYIRSGDQAVEFANRLQNASRNYLAIVSPQADVWPAPKIGQEVTESLQRLRLSQHRPLLLAALEQFDEVEWIRLVRAVVSWSVRGLLVGGIGGGTTERYFSDAAVAIRNGKSRSASDVFLVLQEMIPSDEAFIAAAEIASMPRAYLARYLWLAYDQYQSGATGAAFVTASREAQVALVRVLASPDFDEAESFVSEDISAWAKRLGNALVLESQLLLGGRPAGWPELRRLAQTSSLPSAKLAAASTEWTPEAIRTRQHAFAQAAPLIWPRAPEEIS
jgi:hypothetical protein